MHLVYMEFSGAASAVPLPSAGVSGSGDWHPDNSEESAAMTHKQVHVDVFRSINSTPILRGKRKPAMQVIKGMRRVDPLAPESITPPENRAIWHRIMRPDRGRVQTPPQPGLPEPHGI